MANISPATIKQLRDTTGAGMMDCKKALQENNGNIDEATDWLRKKGLAAAAKKSGRVAAEGLVSIEGKETSASIIELNSETDFVARNEQFQQLAKGIAHIALRDRTGDVDTLKNAPYPETGRSVADEITNAVGVIGENIQLRRAATVEVENGVVATYLHNSVTEGLGKIGILVALKSDGDKEQLRQLGKQIAMHIAAARPEALTRDEVDSANIERERDVFKEQALSSGKPENVIEKMVEGRIRKYYEEVVLLEQTFVIDNKTKISDVVANAAKEIGKPVEIQEFVRFELGEGVEKEEEDFAAEVAKAAGSAS